MRQVSRRRLTCMNKVLLFAHLKEQVGSDELKVQGTGKTVLQLRRHLEEEMQLGSLVGVMVAINEEFATDEMVIQPGDEIALIPPVSGG